MANKKLTGARLFARPVERRVGQEVWSAPHHPPNDQRANN